MKPGDLVRVWEQAMVWRGRNSRGVITHAMYVLGEDKTAMVLDAGMVDPHVGKTYHLCLIDGRLGYIMDVHLHPT